MAASEPQDMAVLPTQVVVCSETDPSVTYLVQLPYCPCKDFRYRRAGLLARLAAGDVTAVGELFCKHLIKGVTLVGGWHREPEPPAVPETTTYYRLTRPRAVTLLTSAYLASELVERLLLAACGAQGMTVTACITKGDVLVKYDSEARQYTVTLPAAQPVSLPGNWSQRRPALRA